MVAAFQIRSGTGGRGRGELVPRGQDVRFFYTFTGVMHAYET